MLKPKRGNAKHSDILYTLENLMSVPEFKEMTADEMIIHMCPEKADNTMSRLSREVLAGTITTITKFRIKVTDAENSILRYV